MVQNDVRSPEGPDKVFPFAGPGEEDLLVLAPMAEITHPAFRHLAEGFGGCGIYYTEMLSAAALLNSSPFEKYYTDLSPRPEKTIIQLVGSDPEYFRLAAEKLSDTSAAGIDINMGCSIGLIRKKGWGVGLMSDREKAREIVKNVRAAVPDKNLSVKLRLGMKEDDRFLLDFCRMLVDEGVDFIALNPKTGREGRNRTGRWDRVAFLKDSLSVPVLGNSDVKDWDSYRSRKDKADGVMIGRGAVISPWIFALLKGGGQKPGFSISINLRDTAERFFILLKEYQPMEFHLSRARRFFYYYTENLKFSHRLRYDIQNAPNLKAVEELVEGYFERNPEETEKRFQSSKESGSP